MLFNTRIKINSGKDELKRNLERLILVVVTGHPGMFYCGKSEVVQPEDWLYGPDRRQQALCLQEGEYAHRGKY